MNAFLASLRNDVARTPVRSKKPQSGTASTPSRRATPVTKLSGTPSRSSLPQCSGSFLQSPPPPTSRRRSNDETIQVAVRVRSLLPREESNDVAVLMKERTTQLTLPTGEKKLFSFDHCLWSHNAGDEAYVSQEDVYLTLGTQLVDSALRGFNSTLFAYGQTGSGKTYSMYGDGSNPDNEGLIPRVCKELFQRLEAAKAEGQFVTCKVQATMTEVYLENIYDLLNSRERLAIRGSLETGFYVPGLHKFEVQDYGMVVQLLQRGAAQRMVASTELNDSSSRAHCLFDIHVKQITAEKTITSKISLVDLAGSERVKESKVEGVTLTQSCSINKSLLNLGNCMEAIVESGKNPSRQIPFRDSTLTKLLKESLGGNARTILLVTISPTLDDAPQTLAALRFADRAKQIRTHAVLNADALQEAQQCSRLVQEQYEGRLQRLQEEMRVEMRHAEIRERELELERELSRLTEERLLLSAERESNQQLTAAKCRDLEAQEAQLEQKFRAMCAAQEEVAKQRAELDSQAVRIMQDQNERKLKKQLLEEEHMVTLEKLKTLEGEAEDHLQAAQAREIQWLEERQGLQQQLEDQEAEWQQDLATRETQWAQQMEALQAQAATQRETLILEWEGRLANVEARAASAEAEAKQLRTELATCQRQAAESETQMKRREDAYKRELEVLEAENKMATVNASQMLAHHKSELEAVKNAADVRQQRLVEEHEAQLKETISAFHTQVASMESDHRKELERLQASTAAQLAHLHEHNAQVVNAMAERHTAELEKMRAEWEAQDAARRERDSKRCTEMADHFQEKLQNMQTSHAAEVSTLRSEIENFEFAAKAAIQAHTKEMAELGSQHKKEISQLQLDLETAAEVSLQRVQDAHRREGHAHEERMSELISAHRRELASVKQQIVSSCEEELQRLRESHRNEVEVLKVMFNSQHADIQAAHSAEKAALVKEHLAQMNELEQEAEQRLASQLRQRSQRHQTALAELQEALEADGREAACRHSQEVQRLRSDSSRKEEEWTVKLQQLEGMFRDMMAVRELEHESAQAEWDKQRSALLDKIAYLESTVTESKVELCDKEDQLQKLSDLFLKCNSVLSTSSHRSRGDSGASPRRTPSKASFLTSPGLSPGYSLTIPALSRARLSDITNVSVNFSAIGEKENERAEIVCPVLHI